MTGLQPPAGSLSPAHGTCASAPELAITQIPRNATREEIRIVHLGTRGEHGIKVEVISMVKGQLLAYMIRTAFLHRKGLTKRQLP